MRRNPRLSSPTRNYFKIYYDLIKLISNKGFQTLTNKKALKKKKTQLKKRFKIFSYRMFFFVVSEMFFKKKTK